MPIWRGPTPRQAPWQPQPRRRRFTIGTIGPTTLLPDAVASGEVVFGPDVTLAGLLLPNPIGTQESVPSPTVKLQVLPGTITTAESVPSVLIGGTVQHYYTTTFPLTEDPLVEAGLWRLGRREGTYWRDFKTSGGNAYGKQDGGPGGGPLFDDSIACLVGTFGEDQYARGTVYTTGTTGGWPEVELLLRWVITPNFARGYEVFFSTNTNTSSSDDHNYCTINRWQGVPGTTFADFKTLANVVCPSVANGDVVEATIVGNTIRAYKNGVLIATGTDVGTYGAPWTGGTPGIGHNWWNDGTVDAAKATQFGFQDYTAQTFVTVSPNPIATGATVFAPTVSLGSSAQSVGPATIATAAAVPAPMATTQILPGTISTAGVVFAPGIVTTGGTLVAQPAGIATAEQVYAPLLRYPQTVTPNAIPSAELVYLPVVGVPIRELFPQSIASAARVYPPAVRFAPRPPAPPLVPRPVPPARVPAFGRATTTNVPPFRPVA